VESLSSGSRNGDPSGVVKVNVQGGVYIHVQVNVNVI
jgi:hypothetical protein